MTLNLRNFCTFAVLLFVGFLHFWVLSVVPPYVAWDNDQVALIDLISIQSQILPAHLNHPSFGQFLVQWILYALADAMNFLSIRSVAEVAMAPNPLPALLDTKIFLKALSPICTVLMCLFMALSASLPFRKKNSLISVLVFLFFSTAPAIYYHAALIRSELYAMLFWAMALYLASRIYFLERQTFSTKEVLAIGLLLGLAFFTKIQIFFLLFFPMSLVLFASNSLKVSNSLRLKFIFGLAVPLILSVWWTLGYWHTPSEDFVIFALDYNPNPTFYLFALLLLIGTLSWWLPAFDRFFSNTCQLNFRLLNIILGGFCLLIPLHFFFPLGVFNSWELLLSNTKVVFFRNYSGSTGLSSLLIEMSSVPGFLAKVKTLASFYGVVIWPMALLIFAPLWASKSKDRLQWIGFLILYAAAMNLSTRFFFWRDHFFTIAPLLFLATLGASYLEAKRIRYFSAIVAVLFIAGISINLFNFRTYLKEIHLHYNHYGYRKDYVIRSAVGGTQSHFDLANRQIYDSEWIPKRPCALENSMIHRYLIREAVSLFPSLAVSSQRSSVLCEGFAANQRNSPPLITKLPKEHQGALLIPANYLKHDENLRINAVYLRGDDYLNNDRGFKIYGNGPKVEDLVPAIYQEDLEIYLAAENTVIEAIPRDSLQMMMEKTPLGVEILDRTKKQLEVYKLKSTIFVPRGKGEFFFYMLPKKY